MPRTAQTNTDEMTVNVSGTATICNYLQNTDNLSWFQGQSNTINWSVNNNTLPGSANVNILSVDGGATFLCYWQVIPQMMALRQL
jgi:hypothetical protein